MGGILDIFGASKAAKAQTKAAQQAAQASQYATDQSIALQREQFDRIWGATQTSREAGEAATGRLAALSGLSVNGQPGMSGDQVTDWLRSTPGYDFNMREGQRQLEASRASRGMSQSGSALRAAVEYGQNYGDRIYNQERGALQSLAGLGQSALNTGAGAGQNMANASQSALLTNADNQGSSYRDIGAAKAGFWGTMAGAFGQNAMGNQVGNALRGFMKGK